MDTSRRRAVVARTLFMETMAAEVAEAFRARGIESVLLKGPSTERLYASGERTYVDCDFVLPPGEYDLANEVLAELGFTRILAARNAPDPHHHHADVWQRGMGYVELHYLVWGVGASPAVQWAVLSELGEPQDVDGLTLNVLAPRGHAFNLAVHAAQHGETNVRAVADLKRGLAAYDAACWAHAADVASRLDAVPAFASGLRLTPEGARLADELGLPHERPTSVALRTASAPSGAFAIDRIVTARGVRARVRLAARTVFPPPEFMRAFFPQARQGRLGLARAYGARLATRTRQLRGGLAAWRHARRPG